MDTSSDHLPRGLVAVFEDDAAAQRAATALRSIGVRDAAIHTEGVSRGPMADSHDELAIDEAVDVDPEVAAATGAVTVAVAAPVGALIALPFALIPFGGWPLWVRLICVAIVGAVAASVWATVMAVPSIAPEAADGTSRDPADHRGTVVRVDDYSTQIARVVANEHPVSVDVIDLR